MEEKFDVICIGLMVANIPIYPVSNNILNTDVTLINKLEITPGGDALNQALILSRLGRKVGICGKIGPDIFGRYLSEEIQKNRIDVSVLITDNQTNTNGAAVLIREDGSRHFLSYRGASDSFSLNDIIFDKIANTRIISFGSLFALPLFRGNALTQFLIKAKDRGCITVADTKQDNYHVGWKGIEESAKYLDYFLPSYDEAAYFSGETEPGKMAAFFADAGIKNIVIKLGDRGCFVRSPENKKGEIIPAMKVEAIDTTGAGDNFVAGFLHGILYGWDLLKCCSFANAVGAISTTKIGATNAIQSEIQVKEFIQTQKGV